MQVFFGNAIVINILILLFYNYECNQTFLCGDHEELKVYRIRPGKSKVYLLYDCFTSTKVQILTLTRLVPGWRELVVVLTCIQCLFAITRMWWYVVEPGIPITNALVIHIYINIYMYTHTHTHRYVVERGIPITNAIIVENSKHPRTNSMWSMLVCLSRHTSRTLCP